MTDGIVVSIVYSDVAVLPELFAVSTEKCLRVVGALN